jgi:HK97 gp10 family phage protein
MVFRPVVQGQETRARAHLKEQADELATAIKAEAPVKSGALRDSVKVRRRRKSSSSRSSPAARRRSRKSAAAAGVDYDYALAVEYGTVNAPAEPFFYNTARELMPEIRQNIEQAVADVLQGVRGMSANGTRTIIWANGEDQFCLAKVGLILDLEANARPGFATVMTRLEAAHGALMTCASRSGSA